METFIFIATGNLDKEIPTGYCICKHCFERVETGIMNLAYHWSNCSGKEEFELMMKNPELYIKKKKESLKLL
jgi:hypothetical protein